MGRLLRFLFPVLAAGAAAAGEVCDLVIETCPGKMAGSTVTVPMKVVSVSPRVPFCDEVIQKSVGAAARQISILFVIDESGSMQGTDTGGSRLTVPAALLDQINAFAPTAEVGLVAFSGKLEFDYREHSYLKAAFPADPSYPYDSYVPLTPLNRAFPGGKTGLDTLKDFLKVKYDTTLDWNGSIDAIEESLLYGTDRPPVAGSGGTDITLGFDAARVAMKESKALPEDRYIIFLSDGEPTGNRPNKMDFQKGMGMPTTFTVYFTGRGGLGGGGPGTVPASIVTMTDNIKVNGYSASNPKSAYWGIDLPAAELRTLLQNQILGRILVFPTRPKEGVIIAGGVRHATTASDTGHFLFPKRMALTGATTPLDFAFTYSYRDTSGGVPADKDTLTRFSFSVRRQDGLPLPPGFSTSCREQAQVSLQYANLPISTVTSDHANLQIRLVPSPGNVCNGCKVQVQPHLGPDRESVALAPGAGFSIGAFPRSLSATPAIGDGALQHTALDSIVLIYQNPDIPLDVVRVSYPFRDIPPQPAPPTLDLYHEGVKLNAVRWDQADLEIRMVFAAGDSCKPCQVQARPSGGTDRETVALAVMGAYMGGPLSRELNPVPAPGDRRLQHGAMDSVILLFTHPGNPSVTIRRSYPFIPPPPVFQVKPINDVARQDGLLPPDGKQWILVGPGNLAVKPLDGTGCCRLVPSPLSPADSQRYVGVTVEASREFQVRIQVFSNLGHVVNRMGFAVPKEEFAKLPQGSGKDTRVLRILWDNRASDGSRCGTGAFVVRTTITLAPGPNQAAETRTASRLVGVVESW